MEPPKPLLKGDELAQFTIQHRGYLVVGFSFAPCAAPGDHLITWAHMQLSQPIVLTQETDWDDWIEQDRVLDCKFANDPEVPRKKHDRKDLYRFFRAITD